MGEANFSTFDDARRASWRVTQGSAIEWLRRGGIVTMQPLHRHRPGLRRRLRERVRSPTDCRDRGSLRRMDCARVVAVLATPLYQASNHTVRRLRTAKRTSRVKLAAVRERRQAQHVIAAVSAITKSCEVGREMRADSRGHSARRPGSRASKMELRIVQLGPFRGLCPVDCGAGSGRSPRPQST